MGLSKAIVLEGIKTVGRLRARIALVAHHSSSITASGFASWQVGAILSDFYRDI